MKHEFDLLVIGSGLAGLSFALKAAEFGTVAIVTKKEISEANTSYAQGGISGVMNLGQDSFEKHVQDTLTAGAGECDQVAVEAMVTQGPRLIQELVDYGVAFTTENGKLHLGREGGHSENRIVHAADATGWEVERVMVHAVKSHPNITIFEHHFAMELLTEHHLGQKVKYLDTIHCFGAYVLEHATGNVKKMLAKATILAAGGAGQVYAKTTNPLVATGDGVAMAYRAKARIKHMEFIQFHPTALNVPESDSFLISEALRGHGAILRNADGEAFMPLYDSRKDLAPRDIVARAIDDQLKKRGDKSVFLDVTHLPEEEIKEAFPTIYETCLQYGIDITNEWIPVVPAAHYVCGGIETDLDGRTSIERLYACGEVACTGVHGANRLASNSLLEALFFADQAVKAVSTRIQGWSIQADVPEWDESGTFNTKEWVLISHNREELQQIMSNYVGIVRSDLRLERALRRQTLLYHEVEDFYTRTRVTVPLCELRNQISIAYLIIRSAMSRKENRGLHYNMDAVGEAAIQSETMA
ncbi:MAG: L-aspartate oxidase [Bacteroidota bacterium]